MKIRWKFEFLILLMILMFRSEIWAANNQTVDEFMKNEAKVVENFTKNLVTNDLNIEFNTSIIGIKIDTNRTRIIKNVDNYIFLFSNNELYALNLSINEISNLRFIGKFEQLGENVDFIEIEFWNNVLMTVIGSGQQVLVYVVNTDFNRAQVIQPINKIELDSSFNALKLLKLGDELYMTVLLKHDRLLKQINLYKWKLSFFSLVNQQQFEIPDNNEVYFFKKYQLLMVVGRDSNTIIQLLRIQETSDTLLKLQKRTFFSNYFIHYQYKENLYLKGCSVQAPCGTYKWSGNHFTRYSKIKKNFFKNISGAYERYNMIILRDLEALKFYLSDSIELQPSFQMDFSRSNKTDFSLFLSDSNQIYFVDYNTTLERRLTIRFHRMTFQKPLSIDARSQKAEAPQKCVEKLKMLLKYRQQFVESIKKNSDLLKPLKDVNSTKIRSNIEKKKIIRAKSTTIKQSKIKNLKISHNISFTGDELLKNVTTTNIRIGEAAQQLRKLKFFNSTADLGAAQARQNEEWENMIVTRNLIYRGNQEMFKGFLLKSQPKVLRGNLVAQKLVTRKLTLPENRINDISLSDVLEVKDFSAGKKIRGEKVFQRVNLGKVELGVLNSANFDEFLTDLQQMGKDHYIFNADLNVESLVAEKINGISWSKFLDDLYMKKNQTTLKGNLILTNVSRISSLNVELLGPVPVDSLLTTSTDQDILADVLVTKFHAENIAPNFLNGEKFGENVALINQENVIETPTQFMTLHINKNLTIEDRDGDEMRANENRDKTFELIKRHVIGTKIEDLMQIYNNEVRIKGSLTLRDVLVESPRGSVSIGEQEVPLNITDTYWLKNVDQEIPIQDFKFQSPISTVQIFTKDLNSHPARKYFLIDGQEPQGFVSLVIQNGAVEGSVVSRNPSVPSLISIINSTAVRRGETTQIFSTIFFNGHLSVKDLRASRINQKSVALLATANHVQPVFTGTVFIKNLTAHQFLVGEQFKIQNYNSVNLDNFYKNLVRIDRPSELDSLILENFECGNLTVNQFENFRFNDLFQNLDNEFSKNNIDNKKTVTVFGNVIFANLKVESFNEILNVPDFLAMVVPRNHPEPVMIGGVKTFKEDVVLEQNLVIDLLNDFKLEEFLNNVLLKSEKQLITAPWTIRNLKVNSLKTRNMNNVPNFWCLNKQVSAGEISMNLEVDELTVDKLSVKSVDLDFQKIFSILKNPQRLNWDRITVSRGAFINISPNSSLDKLINFGVCKNCPAQVITGKVLFLGQNVAFESILKPNDGVEFPGGFLNFRVLKQDSLQKFSVAPQILKSQLVFNNPIYAKRVLMDELTGFLSVGSINDVPVQFLNRSIFRISENNILDSGLKVFRNPIIADELFVHDGLINGVPLNTLVFMEPRKNQFRNLRMWNLQAINVKCQTFNGVSLFHHLQNRMRKTGSPQEVKKFLTFEWLELAGESQLSSINGVFIEDIVFTKSNKLQDIKGHKRILGNLQLIGPTSINFINQRHFLDTFKSILRTNQNYKIEYLLLPRVELQSGLIVSNSMNSRNINDIIYSDQKIPAMEKLMPLIPLVQTTIANLKSQVYGGSKKLLYVDYDPNIDIVYQDQNRFLTARNCPSDIQLVPSPNKLALKMVKKRALEYKTSLSVNLTIFTSLTDHKCQENSMDSNSSWIGISWTQNGLEFSENFTFPNHINDIKVMEPPNNKFIFMIVIFENPEHQPNMLAIYELDKTTNVWRENLKITEKFNDNTITAVVDSHENQFLLVSSFQEDKPSLRDCLHIFKYDEESNNFIEISRILEKFDLILDVTIEKKKLGLPSHFLTFLILAKSGDKKLSIYQYKMSEMKPKFTLFSKINFEAGIVDIVVTNIEDKPYFIVSLKDGYFYIYQWKGIEGWKQLQYGYFSEVNQVKSYDYLRKQYLFLLSSQNSATALSIYKQGEKN